MSYPDYNVSNLMTYVSLTQDIKHHIKIFVPNWLFDLNTVYIYTGSADKFSYFSTKTYVVGTQKNRLNEMVLMSTQNIC